MAQDRRVIMKTSVLPTATTAYAAVPGSLEEYNISKATYNKNTISTTIGRLGGSSKMTDIDEVSDEMPDTEMPDTDEVPKKEPTYTDYTLLCDPYAMFLHDWAGLTVLSDVQKSPNLYTSVIMRLSMGIILS